MPIRKTNQGWFWGSKGPFDTKAKALSVARAAYASGYKEAETMAYNCGLFVGNLLHAVTVTHMQHLITRSYAEHKALGAFYDGLGDLVDKYAEAYQGRYGLITDYAIKEVKPSSPLEYMISLLEYVDQHTEEMPDDSELHNIVDEIKELIDSTLYKLRFLS